MALSETIEIEVVFKKFQPAFMVPRFLPCSILGAEERDTLELPVKLGLHTNGHGIGLVLITFSLGIGSEPDSGDKVFIITLRILVNWTAVMSLLGVELLAASTTRRRTLVVSRGSCRLRSNVNNRERLIWILRSGIL